MANEHDEAIEKVLAALKNAAPLDGMEARIAQRLEYHSAPKAQSGWRGLLAGSTIASAWWRGALSGGLVATAAACSLFLFEYHSMRHPPAPPPIASSTDQPEAIPINGTPAIPCSSPAILRAQTNAPSTSVTIARGASPGHSRPIFQLGLTSEERALIRLTRIAEPHQIATLNSEIQARVDAADAAAFKKFFTPPPRPKIDEWQPESVDSEGTAPTQQSDQPQSAEQSTPPTSDLKGPQ